MSRQFGRLEALVECSILHERLGKLIEALEENDLGRIWNPAAGEVWALSTDAVEWLDKATGVNP